MVEISDWTMPETPPTCGDYAISDFSIINNVNRRGLENINLIFIFDFRWREWQTYHSTFTPSWAANNSRQIFP